MLRIESSGMPIAAVARMKTDPTFSALTAVTEVRQVLAAEQDFRCAYCERRLSLDGAHGTRIEHFHPQSGTAMTQNCQSQSAATTPADAQVEWKNLLLCCDGTASDGDSTCDVRKSSTDVCDALRNPKRAPHSVATLVRVGIDGLVSPIAAIDAASAEVHLNETLNLNHKTLVRNRLFPDEGVAAGWVVGASVPG